MSVLPVEQKYYDFMYTHNDEYLVDKLSTS
jgi:hypothetical protein